MINGSFGAGKTSTAQQLQPLIPNSMIYDPEEVGYMLRKIIPEDVYLETEKTDDFQDIELWRVLVVQTAQALINKYHKHLIVPMTLYKSENFDYIYDGFKNIDAETFHFCLVASEETLKKRVEQRGDTFSSWYEKHVEAAVNAFAQTKFNEHIYTDLIDTEEVIAIILDKISKND
ncbi:AAA family ATPase [Saccharibacillus sp. JS10]|uniref:AAA family ATPase n=1 Tax=Saccharibacillus sp. JS10 TaxID=2950552 RepID=UPI00210C149C|nr:AAA family ATPase [Saccharibacillus sp. JS10]MCQ4086995.1 AAA family ATPase [Saccharibacillus sp. JS10]